MNNSNDNSSDINSNPVVLSDDTIIIVQSEENPLEATIFNKDNIENAKHMINLGLKVGLASVLIIGGGGAILALGGLSPSKLFTLLTNLTFRKFIN